MSPTGPKRTAIYARVSTDDRGQDPENQLRQLRAWCGRMGHPIVREYVEHESGRRGTDYRRRLAAVFDGASRRLDIPLQRSAHTGALTDSSYVQLVGQGVASIDLGFPMRYSHSSLEVCDLGDLEGLTMLLVEGIASIDGGFSLDRDDYE